VKKVRKIICERKKFPKNYGDMRRPTLDCEVVWDLLCELTENGRYRVRHHIVQRSWTEDPDAPKYKPFGDNPPPDVPAKPIPVGTLTWELVAYLELAPGDKAVGW
jgi:hypothetical protein